MPEVFTLSPEQLTPDKNIVDQVAEMIWQHQEVITVKPKYLRDKPYSITLYREIFSLDDDPDTLVLSFRGNLSSDTNNQAFPGIEFSVGFTFLKTGDEINASEAIGFYSNDTQREVQQFKGITAVFSPIDDAISQAVANITGKPVRRFVATDYPVVAKLLKQRNFNVVKEATFPDTKDSWLRVFSPQKNDEEQLSFQELFSDSEDS